jgi:3-isopropylmalate/(R)-2-methylmalate dehydratase large subunit
MTMTQKIFAAHAGRDYVAPGENVWVDVDVLLTHDVCGPGTIGIFKKEFGPDAKVWDPDRVVIIPDHYIFTADGKCHRNVQTLRDFVAEHKLPWYYDPDFLDTDPDSGMPASYRDPSTTSYKGVCHKALPEEGHVRPGELLLGTDSHTCTAGALGMFATGVGNTDAAFTLGTGKTWLKTPPTMKFAFHGEIPSYLTAKDLILAVIGHISVSGATYKTMYFAGDGIGSLSLEDRMTLTNMAIEAGGKNGICDVDEKTLAYVRNRSKRPDWTVYEDDPGVEYIFEHEWDLAAMEPMVAKPHSPDNKDLARNCEDVQLDRAYLGSCTGGKITDMLFAANILHGNEVKIPTYVVPGSTEVHRDMQRLNLYGEPLNGNESPPPPGVGSNGSANGDGVPITLSTPAIPGISGPIPTQSQLLARGGESPPPPGVGPSNGDRKATTSIYDALEAAGCLIGPASCAACLGGPQDTFGRLNEPMACISSTNRNFPGRMGHKSAGVFLASPLTVAASALTGHVTDPREYVSEPITTGSAGVV